ncbi:MAG: PfkB family carbohydrate kinase [Candidatus Heimdallarchaeaceae archaeon]
MTVDLNILSHVVLDNKIFFTEYPPKKIDSQLGGPASYASMVIPLLPIKAQCITSVGEDFPEGYRLYLSTVKNYSFLISTSKRTTRFLHEIYKDRRILYLHEQANPLDNLLIMQDGGRACLLSPVFKEISKFSVEWAIDNHNWVGVDVQGFSREKDESGKIYANFKRDFFSFVTNSVNFVKYSLNEAKNFTKKDSYPDILNKLPHNNVQIVTMGNKGLLYSDHGQFYKLTAPVQEVTDPTGAGDVMIAGFLTKFIETEELDLALAFGMALAAEKVTFSEIKTLTNKDYISIAEGILETKERIE